MRTMPRSEAKVRRFVIRLTSLLSPDIDPNGMGALPSWVNQSWTASPGRDRTHDPRSVQVQVFYLKRKGSRAPHYGFRLVELNARNPLVTASRLSSLYFFLIHGTLTLANWLVFIAGRLLNRGYWLKTSLCRRNGSKREEANFSWRTAFLTPAPLPLPQK